MKKLPRPLMPLAATGAVATLALVGCSADEAATNATQATDSASSVASSAAGGASQSMSSASSEVSRTMDHDDHDDHGNHDHMMDGGPAPEGIQPAANPKFPVGTEVEVLADHMPGMKGEDATVVGVFDTTTYSVSYTPTDGGALVKDHRWVVHEELDNPGAAPLADGTEITINAEHMKGMKGAKGTVDYSTQEPVYMITIDDDDMVMKNHKWVTESELRAED